MRRLALVVLAPLALVACGDDDRPIVINTPPAATVAPPSAIVVPAQPGVVIEQRR